MGNLRVFILIKICLITSSLSCDLKSSLDEDSACEFDALMLVNARTGFTVAEGNCGIEIDKAVFVEQPYVFFPYAKEDAKYTLIMVDNDDPFTDDGKQFLQWLVINIDGTSLKYGVGEFYGETYAGDL